MPRSCKNSPNSFCYIYGDFVVAPGLKIRYDLIVFYILLVLSSGEQIYIDNAKLPSIKSTADLTLAVHLAY